MGEVRGDVFGFSAGRGAGREVVGLKADQVCFVTRPSVTCTKFDELDINALSGLFCDKWAAINTIAECIVQFSR